MENSPSVSSFHHWKKAFSRKKYYYVKDKYILRQEIIDLCSVGFTFKEAVRALYKAGKYKTQTTKQVICKRYAKVRGVY